GDALPHAHRQVGVRPAADARRAVDDSEQGAGAAVRPPARPAAGPGRGDPQGAGEEARGPLPRRGRLPPGARALRPVNGQEVSRAATEGGPYQTSVVIW